MSIGHLYVLFGEVSIQILCPLVSWIVCVFGFELCEFFINFEYNPLLDVALANMFSHSEGYLFILLMVSFVEQTFLVLCSPIYFYFLIIFPLPKEIYQKKILVREISEILLPIFFSRSFMVSGLIFKSLIHFEFIFVYGVRKGSSFHLFFACIYSIFTTSHIEETVFTTLYILASFVIG